MSSVRKRKSVEHQRTRKAEETFQVPGGLGRCNLLSVRELSPDGSGRFERRLESMPTNSQLEFMAHKSASRSRTFFIKADLAELRRFQHPTRYSNVVCRGGNEAKTGRKSKSSLINVRASQENSWPPTSYWRDPVQVEQLTGGQLYHHSMG